MSESLYGGRLRDHGLRQYCRNQQWISSSPPIACMRCEQVMPCIRAVRRIAGTSEEALNLAVLQSELQNSDTEAFIATCSLLCSSSTTCLVAIERRTAEVYDRFVNQAKAAFSEVCFHDRH